jgi:hypothetical protein
MSGEREPFCHDRRIRLGLRRIVAETGADFPTGRYIPGAKNCVTKVFPFGKSDAPHATARSTGNNSKKDAPMTIYGYVRCSTDKQTVLQQVDALRAYGCEKIFRDKAASAGTARCKGLLALKRALKPGDTLVDVPESRRMAADVRWPPSFVVGCARGS